MFIKIENEIIALAANDIKLEVMSSDKSQIPKANAFSHTASMLRNYVSRGESGVIWREGEEPQESSGNGEHEHRT